jgi:cell division protein FtsB
MPKKNEQSQDRSKIAVRIGEVQVEIEGTQENIKKLMNKELFEFTKGLEATTKQQFPSPIEAIPEISAKKPEVAPKETAAPPPPPIKSSTTAQTPSQSSRVPTIGKKTEMGKMGRKKISWKPVAIALVLVCIVVSAGLVGVLAVYLPMVNDLNSQIAEKNADLATFTTQIGSLNAQVAYLQNSLDQSNSTIENLQEGVETLNLQIQNYLNLLYLNASMYLFSQAPVRQNASTDTPLFQDAIQYAGYVGVNVQSTSNTTYVQALYSSFKVNYNNNVTVGLAGTAYFPVLPGTLEIRVGNTDTYQGDFINATATAIYYF